ncbi:MAG TPA: outer membrane beta-barrel protein [Bacteroidales bacterium]
MTKLDNFYKEAFAGFEYKLSGSFWLKVKLRLFWSNYKFFIAGGAAIAVIGSALFFGLPREEANSLPVTNPATNFAISSTLSSTQEFEINEKTENEGLEIHEETIAEVLVNNTSATETKTSTTSKTDAKNYLLKAESHNAELAAEAHVFIESENKREVYSTEFLSTLSLSDLNNLQPELLYDSTSNLFIPKQKVKFSLLLSVSPSYNTVNLQSQPIYDEVRNYQLAHESSAVSYSAGLDFQVTFKNWFVQTGLAYSRFKNNRNYNYSFSAFDSLQSHYVNDTTWGWLFDPPITGEPIIIGIDSVFVPVYNQINEGSNEWECIEIPLLAGYNFNKSRFTVNIATGFSYGIYIKANGNVPSLSEQNVFTNLSEIEDKMNRHQFNYLLQVGVSYHITPDWSIMAYPFYKQNLQSVFDNNYPIDERFRTFGIKFGFIVNL